MENEKHFYPTLESKEQPTHEYSVNFLSFTHPEAEKAERTYDTNELLDLLKGWWKQTCDENNIDPNDKKLKNVDYYIMELGKNALEHAGGGEIKVIFEPAKITVIVTDQGQGFEDLNDVDYCSSAQYGHGLHEVKRYADEFYVESGGRKYAKIKGKKKLTEIETTDVTMGSKITFIKNFE